MNKQYRQILKRIFIIISVFFIVHLSALLIPAIFQWADIRVHTLFFYLRQFLQGKQEVSPYLVLFTLDDDFEKRYNTPGRERTAIAEALETIREAGSRTILFDIIYRERDSTPGEDEKLVQATRSLGNVFYPFVVNRNIQSGDTLPECTSGKIPWPLNIIRQGKPVKVGLGITPFPELCRAARGLGGITHFPESDGIIHRIPLVYSFRGELIPSIVLAGICHYYRVVPGTLSIAFGKYIILPGATLPGGRVKDIAIPVDSRGQLIVNFTGPWRKSITSFSLENLLSSYDETGRAIPVSSAAPDSLVLFGDMTTTSKDISRGIFEENYPMVGILHNSLNTILTGHYLYQPGHAEQIIISLLVLFILFLTGFLRKEDINPAWLFFLFCIYVLITFILFIVSGRLPDISLHFFAFTVSGIILFRMELAEIRKLMASDDALEVPVVIKPDDSRTPDVPVEKTGEHRESTTGRLKELGLTDTQLKIAGLLTGGLQYKEIGFRLSISATATGRRINRIYKKLGINNKIELFNIVNNKEK